MNEDRISIDGRLVGSGQPVFVIAEAGVNHNGDLTLARRLVAAAAEAGADAVKFQTFKAERVTSASAPKAAYQIETTGAVESQLEMLRALELSPDMHRALQADCVSRGILFLSTPFDESSVDLLDDLGVSAFKLPSGEVTNWPLLRHAAKKGKPVILSTGMSYLSEVADAVDVLRAAGCDQMAVLHCVSQYPADPADANLRAMAAIRERCKVPVGYSDHAPGAAVALAAVALGACVIEKHFTIDCDLPGPDHRASLEPDGLNELVAGIRAIERALGDGEKVPAAGEISNRDIVRRSLVAAELVPCGSVLRREMLIALRPAGGIAPSELDALIGRRVRRDLAPGESLRWTDID